MIVRNIKRDILVSITLAAFLLGNSARAGDEITFSIKTSKHTLDNGLTVLAAEMPSDPVVSLYALVKVGSAMEGKFMGGGLTHFVEHMLFKGTERRGVGRIAGEVQALGGSINATTSHDYTLFTLTVPRERFGEALDILSDMLMHPSFINEEVEREKQVIAKEIRLHKDNPDYYLSELIFDTVYLRHPYKVPIIGHEDIFLKNTRDDLVEFYKTYYIPNNIIVSVAGDIAPETVFTQSGKAFGEFPRGHDVIRNLPPEPAQISSRWREQEYQTELTRMSLTYGGVSIMDGDMFALDVLAMLLGQGHSSRLYRELFVDKKLVQSVTASNYTPADRGLFEIQCVLEKDNIPEVIRNITALLDRIKRHGAEPAELDKARRQVLAQYVQDHQTTADVAHQAAMDEAFLGDYDFSRKYIESINALNNESIKSAARKYFVSNNMSAIILKPPVKPAELPDVRQPAATAAKIEEKRLPNGLTLLFKADHAIPLVSVNLVLKGGVRQENPQLNGLAYLTALAWDKGTKSLSGQEIAGKAESLGIALSGFSGYTSMGLSMQCLPQDLNFAFGLFMDIVENPVFDSVELAKEKIKMRSAIQERNDSIFEVTTMELRKCLFPGHPLGLTELGTLETLDKLTRQDVIDFYKKLVVPGNMVVSVFGDFDPEFRKRLEAKLASLRPAQAVLVAPALETAVNAGEQTLTMDKSQALVMLGFRGVGLDHPDRYGVELLASVLGSSFQGRIFRKIREEFGQAYTLGGAFYPSTETGLIIFYVSTTVPHIQKVKGMLADLAKEMGATLVGQSELNDMKSYLKGQQKNALETNSALGFRAALDTLYGLGYDHYTRYDAGIDKVSAEDIQRLAKEYLDMSKAVIVVTKTAEPGP